MNSNEISPLQGGSAFLNMLPNISNEYYSIKNKKFEKIRKKTIKIEENDQIYFKNNEK